MYESKRDYVSLSLPTTSIADIGSGLPKKSCKRYWNQLSRFQRNIILVVVVAGFVTVLLLLSGDNLFSDTDTTPIVEHIKIEPFKDHPKNINPAILGRPHIQQPPPVAEPKHHNKESEENSNQLKPNVGKQPRQLSNEQQQVEEPVNKQLDESNQQPAKDDIESDGHSVDFKGPTNDRQHAVVVAFQHSWKGYKEFAWGHDNLKPISMGSHDWFGLGLTIVDALDTMLIMDLQEEFDEARNWVDQHLNFNVNREVNLFEVTIRVLGGLLAAYHLSGDNMFLKKSIDLGNHLMPCFNSPSGIPYSDVNLATMNAHSPKWSPDSSTSEVTTLQLEFRDLARSSGLPEFEQVTSRINEIVHNLDKKDGLVPIFINANTGTFRSFSTISLGARGDSYYEYLLKQWLQTGKSENNFLIEDYKIAIDGVLEHLVKTTPNEHFVYIGELINGKEFKPKMDHLTCYFPGTLLLGVVNGGMPNSHLKLAEDLMTTCYQTYMKQPTFLAPEITYFNIQGDIESDISVKSNDAHNLLRPEFIESLYYFYALTGNRTYQDMGWKIFEAFEKHTKVKTGGYTSIGNVKNVSNLRPRDMMESFFLGETLKYFYLLFSDDRNEIDLKKFVLNSEAHPLPILRHIER